MLAAGIDSKFLILKQEIMKEYFLVKVHYTDVDADGKVSSVKEQYLINAISFSDAETKAIEFVNDNKTNEVSIDNIDAISRTKIEEFLKSNTFGDKYYLTCVASISIDEKTAKEKKNYSYQIINAPTLDEARITLNNWIKESTVDFDICSIKETKIIDLIDE